MAEAVARDEAQRYGVLVLGADAHPGPVDALAAAADVSVETATLPADPGPGVGDKDRPDAEGDGDDGGRTAPAGLPGLLADHDPDCVVVVHDPPAVDGLAVLAGLREIDRSRPVVVAASPDGVTAAAAADADGVLAVGGGPIPPALAADRVRTAVRAAADRRPGPDEADRAEALAATYRVFAEDDRPLTDRAQDLLEVARSTLGLRHARLSQLVEDGAVLEDVAAAGPDIAAGLRTPTGDRGPCEAVVRSEEGLALGDVPAQEPAFATGEHDVGTYVGAPVLVDGEPWGTLCLHDPEPRRDGLDEWSVTLVDLLARWLGTLIEREASDARLESTFERMDDALFTLDRDWVVTDANEPGAAVLRGAMDLPADADPVGRHLWEEVPAAVDTTFHEAYHRAMETGETVAFEEHFPPLETWFEVRAYPDEDGLSVYFTDITERKERDVELERLRELLQQTERIADVGGWEVDADTREVFWSDHLYDLLGFDPEATPPLEEALDVYLEEDRALVEDALTRALERAEPFDLEVRYSPDDETVRWLRLQGEPVVEDGQVDRVRGAAQDVTDRKEREARLNRMLAATRGFVGVDDVDRLTESVIEAVQAVFGYDIVSVRLHDPETDTLPPTAVSGGVERRLPSTPVYDADGDTAFARAFRADEPVVIADATETTGPDRGPLGSGMLVPLGDHGVLSVGATTVDAFDDADAALVELLGLAATAAFDRLERETERRQLRTVVEHVDETAFLLERDGTFRYVTEPLADLLGRDRERLRGTAFEAVLAADAEPVDPVALAGDGARTVETRLRLADRGSRPVEIAVSATGTGDEAAVAGVVTDITELAETRTDLAAERERFERLFETLPDPVAEVRTAPGGELRVTYVNEAFARAVGVSPGPVDDRPLEELVGERVDDAGPPSLEADAPQAEDVRFRTTEGVRDYLRRTVPFGAGAGAETETETGTGTGAASRGFVAYTDVTEGRERERYLSVLNRVLRHNLRNDLTVLLALADRIAEDADDEGVAARARELVLQAEEMSTLGEKARRIEQVLDGGARTEPVDVAPLLADVVAELGADHPRVSVATDVPASLWARAGPDIRRAVAELLENALEHEATGMVRVGARTAPGGDRVEVRVTDDGPGIPDEEWAVVSGDAEVTQLTHGSGLGLWLVRWIVESHGGTMRREQGSDGATVVLELPAATPPEDPAGARSRD